MTEDQKKFLLCLRVKGDGTDMVLDTATITKCTQCGHDVWIAPTGVALVAENPSVMVTCYSCVARTHSDEPMEIEAPPGAFTELADALGLSPTEVAGLAAVAQAMDERNDEIRRQRIEKGQR